MSLSLQAGPAPAATADLSSLLDVIGELSRRAALLESRIAGPHPGAALLRLATGSGLPGDESLLGVPLEGARVVVVRSTRAVQSDLCCAPAPGQVLHLVRGMPRAARTDRALDAARRMAAQAVRAEAKACVGISSPIGAGGLAQAAADARDAALLGHGIVVAADAWAEISLRRLRPHVAVTSLSPLGVLRDYDADHGSDLTGSLATWLRHAGDSGAAARELSVHVNTLRYRLRRACALTGVDLDDPRQRLVLTLVLAP